MNDDDKVARAAELASDRLYDESVGEGPVKRQGPRDDPDGQVLRLDPALVTDPAGRMLVQVCDAIRFGYFDGFISLMHDYGRQRVVVHVTKEYFDAHYFDDTEKFVSGAFKLDKVNLVEHGGIVRKYAAFDDAGNSVMCLDIERGPK